MIWTLYVDGTALASFLKLTEALEILFPFLKEGRRVALVWRRG